MKRLTILLAASLLLVSKTQAADPTMADVAKGMTEAAQKFLASLSPAELAKATRKFDDPARLDWHNIPKPERKGLQVREMSADQRKILHDLLRVSLSPTGYEKGVKIMSLEANLKEGEKNQQGSPLRDTERYFLTIFDKPQATGTWGWSFEGHHFSLNFVIRDGQIIGDTPSFWGANPATVKIFVEGGPTVGTRTLADEEQLAFDLVNRRRRRSSPRRRLMITAPPVSRSRRGANPKDSRLPT
jgi:hypothetical protein